MVHLRHEDDEDGVALADMQVGDDLVDISCCDPDEFDPMTDEDVWRSYDMVEAADERVRLGTLTKTRFGQLSKALGFNLNAHGILADRELRPFVRPTSVTMRDGMHTMFSQGVMNIEIMALLNALAAAIAGFSWKILRDFADAEWHWCPGRLGQGAMVEVFSEGRETSSKTAGVFKAGASETLQVYPLIRHFLIEHVPAASVPTERASFLALCHVADLINDAKFSQTLEVPEGVRGDLTAALVRWRNAHEVAYGRTLLVPKHHFAFHLPGKIYLDCFTHERKNYIVKNACEFHYNAGSFERGTLLQLLLKVIPQMDRVRMTELVGPSAEMRMLGQRWVIARRLRFNGLMLCVGAVIFLGEAGHRAADIQALGYNNHTRISGE